MPEGVLDDRRRALEEAFFRKQEKKQRSALRARLESEQDKGALVAATGIDDEALLERLLGLGIRVETLAALTLVPLVQVAWADGRMEKREREAVLSAARSTGLGDDSPSLTLLQLWIADEPAPDIYVLWAEYIGALCAELDGDESARLERNIVDRARKVAEAAGGFLGLGDKVSKEEEAVLERLAQAFRAG